MGYANKVILFNRLYCGLWVLVSLFFVAILFTGYGLLPQLEQELLANPLLSSQGVQIDQAAIRQILSTLIGYGFFKVALNVVLIFAPRSKAWWWAQLFNHVIGIISCIMTLPGIYILIAWMNPEVRLAYGFGGRPPIRDET